MSVLKQLRQIIPEINDRFPSILVIYLFGSHATGTASIGSDIDVAVFTDRSEPPIMDLELGVFLQQKMKQPVDVVIMQKVSPILQHEILRSKIRVFEKNGVSRAYLETRSFHEYLDAMHYQHKRSLWSKANGQHTLNQASIE